MSSRQRHQRRQRLMEKVDRMRARAEEWRNAEERVERAIREADRTARARSAA